MPDETLKLAQLLATSPSNLSDESLIEYARNYPESFNVVCQEIAQIYLEKLVEKKLAE